MKHPSPFYELGNNAESFCLVFPDSETCFDWVKYFDLLLADVDLVSEDVEAVSLGNKRYRLVDRFLGPFSMLPLHWGDEFIAEKLDESTLKLSRVIMPRIYEHYSYFASPGFSNDHPIAAIVYQLGGGWETVMGGALSLHIPVSRIGEFRSKISALGLLPGFQI